MKLLMFVAWLSVVFVSPAFAGSCFSSTGSLTWIVLPPNTTPGIIKIVGVTNRGGTARTFEASRSEARICYKLTFESQESYLSFVAYFQRRGIGWTQTSGDSLAAELRVLPAQAGAVFEQVRTQVPGIPSSACLRDIVPVVGILIPAGYTGDGGTIL